MRILFAGTPQVAVASLNHLHAAGFDIAAVLTRPDAPLGRKRVLTPSPVAARAEELGLPLIKSSKITDDVTEQLQALNLDAAAIVAFGGLVPQAALSVPRHGWINLHFSLLPNWRGAAPVQHSIIHGDDITGAVTFQLETGLDTGPVFGQVTEVVNELDTAGVMLERLSESGSMLLVQTLQALDAGRAVAVPQTGSHTYAPKITDVDAQLDFSRPATEIRRRAHGTTPFPGAWSAVGEQRYKFGPLRERRDVTDLASGELRIVPGKQPTVLIGTATWALEPTQIQPPGKKMMNASDWARGMLAQGTEVSFA
ncbi:methionyl-tRNA formyltransferase [Glutamicibacter protophormiae]|uniref:Methionyl-tRNA formyltransferase n=1 Tax=Glutamicibacter protophormiae TaxID=37930 RepID=A0ABS4XU09_GLUPR|nr:methionyl-tRNA formyltransferase [Glutamicibacter protophormiae]MBP2400013.1 methionyl-tRNA formyltransferase [Glutamicibacter protophormiae]GGL75941.1 methionyl-tRNA formyltransferase [Glutamicibacter protophormiae]